MSGVSGAPIPALFNTRSGSAGKARDVIGEDARFELRELEPDAIAEAVRAEVDRGTRRVLICGGDGTLGTAFGAAAGTALEVGVLPGGTLNHFARDVGLPVDDPAAALDIAATGVAAGVNLGYVNGHPVVNTCSVGAYVDFVRHRESRKRWLGYNLASAVAAFGVWLRARVIAVELHADDGTHHIFRTPLLFVAVEERILSQTGLGARRPDGARTLHVLVVNDRTRARMATLLFGAILRGLEGFVREDRVDSHFVNQATAVMRRTSATIAIDGELVSVSSPIRFELKPNAVMVVQPSP